MEESCATQPTALTSTYLHSRYVAPSRDVGRKCCCRNKSLNLLSENGTIRRLLVVWIVCWHRMISFMLLGVFSLLVGVCARQFGEERDVNGSSMNVSGLPLPLPALGSMWEVVGAYGSCEGGFHSCCESTLFL